ncbi:N-terminal EF-hand calcium-binding protein 1 [Bulinus truncatus]|nr:N-terminal EF-hand calcium-binding protein 1 [Bulinus truncatus]
MGKEELQNLFNDIDSHNTNNIDTLELCTYFTQHLDNEFKEIFSYMEEMNVKMTSALHGTAKTYKDSARTEKFMTRFFLKEIRNQILALQFQFDAALETLDTQAREERLDIQPVVADDLKKSPASAIVPGHVVRRAKRQTSNWILESEEGGNLINLQIDRVEEILTEADETILLVQREFFVLEDKLEDFTAQLRAYVDTTQGFRGCLNNCDSPPTKTLVSQTAELLKKPETVHSMKIPSKFQELSLIQADLNI